METSDHYPWHTETRKDGWPLCPCCGEDELWSPFAWNGEGERPPIQAWIDAGLRCYACHWQRDNNPTPWPWDGYRIKRMQQCARCGAYELPGTIHVCTDVRLQMTNYPPGGTPALDLAPAPVIVPAQPMPPPGRFVKRGFYMCCTRCGLAIEYCPGHVLEIASPDGAHSDLERRARECKGGT